MTTTPLKPVRLPAVRDQLVRHLRGDMLRHSLENLPPTATVNLPGIDAGYPGKFAVAVTGPVSSDRATSVLNHFADELADDGTELAWIGEQFTSLIADAAQELPDLRFYPDQMPAAAGLIYYAASPLVNRWAGNADYDAGEASCDAISWFTTAHGIWVNMYSRSETLFPDRPRQFVRDNVGYLMLHSPGGGAEFGTHDQQPGGGYRLLSILLATWFLIRQPGVADEQPAPVDRDRQRSYARAGRRYPNVRVFNLRRRPTPEGRTPVPEGRSLSVRFIVRGHWRNQPYGPGRTLRRDRYIDSYLKGPEDAPVKARTPTVKKLD